MRDGEKRPGRPIVDDKDRAKNRTIKLNDADWQKFKKLGAAKWLREKIRECFK